MRFKKKGAKNIKPFNYKGMISWKLLAQDVDSQTKPSTPFIFMVEVAGNSLYFD